MVGKSIIATVFIGLLSVLPTDAHRGCGWHRKSRRAVSTPKRTALIVVDVQNCFLPKGTLAVNQSEQILPVINRIIDACHFDLIVATQDWHNYNHISFASQHKNKKPYDVIPITYRNVTVQQTLWPDHCVIDTPDAELSKDMPIEKYNYIVRKGFNRQIDSYSGFADNGATHYTKMDSILARKNIKRTVVVGLATDFCVQFTSVDASKFQYESVVISDAVRAVGGDAGTKQAFKTMADWKVKVEGVDGDWFKSFCPNY